MDFSLVCASSCIIGTNIQLPTPECFCFGIIVQIVQDDIECSVPSHTTVWLLERTTEIATSTIKRKLKCSQPKHHIQGQCSLFSDLCLWVDIVVKELCLQEETARLTTNASYPRAMFTFQWPLLMSWYSGQGTVSL